MLSRPPHGGHPSNQKRLLLAAALFFVSFLQIVDAAQPSQVRPRIAHPLDHNERPYSVTTIQEEATLQTPPVYTKSTLLSQPQQHKQPHAAANRQLDTASRRKRSEIPQNENNENKDNIIIPTDASALATLAPAQSVRAPHPPPHLRPNSAPTAGLATPHVARSLEDWEVEDFVLLATVDGDLYASDRKTLKERWHLEVDQPMVETKHHRSNASVLDDDYSPIDHYIWAVEPNRDGGLFVWMPDSDAGLVRTGFTMKRLVEDLAPFADEEPPVVYTGDKKTTLITLDAATGKILKWFGSGGSHINEAESCLRPNTFFNMDQTECSSTGTITLGRTEYTVGIQRRDGRPVATLKYSEWGPNNFDNDLLHQYHASLDSRYFTSKHDGNVYAFDPSIQIKPSTHEKFVTPVARVFDVCRPWDAPAGSNPELVVLPQPPMPSRNEDAARVRSQSIFLNRTRTGSWYAMSGRAYPLIIDAPTAQVTQADWLDPSPPWEKLDESRLSKALVGIHYIGISTGSGQQQATLPQSISASYDESENDSFNGAIISNDADEFGIIDKVKTLPQSAANSVIDLISNPALIFVMIIVIVLNERKIRRSYHQFKEHDIFRDPYDWVFGKESKSSSNISDEDEKVAAAEGVGVKPKSVSESALEDVPKKVPDGVKAHELVAVEKEQAESMEAKPEESSLEVKPPLVQQIEPTETAKVIDDTATMPALEPVPEPAQDAPKPTEVGTNGEVSPQKKKKAHRGRRGGVKHRKQKLEDASQSQLSQSQLSLGDKSPPETVDHTIRTANRMADKDRKNNLEPDVLTVSPNDMQAIGPPIVKMGNIEVNTDEQLGSGSNGTLVFAGKFDGRDVAVKRMLLHFYDIALHETKLLRESDDHPNVIRYYSQQMHEGFLYIALERCAASLHDVIEKPSCFRELADAGNRDLPAVLYQITNGLAHLHSLRIVHRDIKPQNILVNMGKDGKPRLLVSDFGLCKKMEDGQSSFGATTGRAAGTSGWRAPELLLDDDARDAGILDTGTNESGSILVVDVSNPLNTRRATRAIDIFGLGLVFFYVLSRGAHPFDCGTKYMREVNIRSGHFNLDHLDSLGDFAFEAKDLISIMISRDPKLRPSAHRIMAHPFFWSAKKRLAFLCDVSDHFEKEPREPPSPALRELENYAAEVTKGDFLRHLPREFIDSLGKQRKYTGSRLLDLLRALRNKRNHYEDMSDNLKRIVGGLPAGYLSFWTTRFPKLLLTCCLVVVRVGWEESDRFREYYQPAGL